MQEPELKEKEKLQHMAFEENWRKWREMKNARKGVAIGKQKLEQNLTAKKLGSLNAV